jgi:phage gpG-like protein
VSGGPVELNIQLEDRALLAALTRALALLASPQSMLDAVGAAVERNAQLRFETKTDPQGQAWAPLSPNTVEIYKSDWFIARNPAFKGGIPGGLLERTRQLRASLGYNVGPDWVDIGTSRQTEGGKWQIGALHEWGTRIMPRRGILTADPRQGQLGPEDVEDILQVVADAIEDSIGG